MKTSIVIITRKRLSEEKPMGDSLAAKLLKNHRIEGTASVGEEIGIRIDQTLTQDATGTMVYLQFESMSIPRVKTELSVSYVDHNIIQSDYKNMDDHLYLQDCAKKYGIFFSRPGNGICHQVHLERFGVPGKTVLGSDSHTPTAGGLGMIAIGAGGLDVAAAMAGAPFFITYPEIVEVRLTGTLPPMCSAKDIILTVLKKETVKGGVGKIYEYTGEGVKDLTVPQRSTITNMGAELGATTSIFPSDSVTKSFLAQQKREDLWTALSADPDAHYDRIIEIDLDSLEPMIAQPHMPDNVVPVREVEGLPAQQVAIGSCTNSSINDLGIASEILSNGTVAAGTSLAVSAGSRQVYISALRAGIIETLVRAGARFLEFACGPCIGMGFAPASGSVSVRTFNRNFKGRSGTADAGVYLASAETAAATALNGKITDPRSITGITGKDYTKYITIDDSLIIPPAPPQKAETVTVRRGPNIKPCPQNSPLPDSLQVRVLLKTEDNITTDHIMPAGASILPLRSNIPEISKHVFAPVDEQFYNRAVEASGGGIIIGGENYGQGSSREHAALAPMYLGVKAVLVKSFARIHKANLINFGIVPLEFKDPADYDSLETGDTLYLPAVKAELAAGNEITVQNRSKNSEMKAVCSVSPRLKQIVAAGGLLNYTRDRIKDER